MPVMFSRMIRTSVSIRRCTSSYSGIPFQEMNVISTIMTGAMTQRMDASPTSIVRVMAVPPRSMIGARIPMVWIIRTKLCTL